MQPTDGQLPLHNAYLLLSTTDYRLQTANRIRPNTHYYYTLRLRIASTRC